MSLDAAEAEQRFDLEPVDELTPEQVHRLRQSYGRLLRLEIAETVVDAAEVDDELRHLLTKIRPWQGY